MKNRAESQFKMMQDGYQRLSDRHDAKKSRFLFQIATHKLKDTP